MKCYCYEENSVFVFCVENVDDTLLEEAILHAAWQKDENKYILKSYQSSDIKEKELLSKNFSALGEQMFVSMVKGFDWRNPLNIIAKQFNDNGIEWYIVGSTGDAVRGIHVTPHDIDIVVHTKDFQSAKNICYENFPEAIISPFVDNHKPLPLRYFGRMFLAGALVEIASDETWNLENRQPKYEKSIWNNHTIYMDSLSLRYNIEIARNRTDRINAIKQFMKKYNGVML